MDGGTARAFHDALDGLQGIDGLLLDCRGMGGGNDRFAWEIAGRFFKRAIKNGRGKKIEPSGGWQFDGAVVMLQDEREVSSAETFTWALSETGRALSVGRPTGGWAMIPKRFELPSGIAAFRLGVVDRETPITNQKTEGVGWPPDVEVSYGPVFCARRDPEREIATVILEALLRDAGLKKVQTCFRQLFDGDVAAFRRSAAAIVPAATAEHLVGLVVSDLRATLLLEAELVAAMPGDQREPVGRVAVRTRELMARAKAAGLHEESEALRETLRSTYRR
jgi:hypothetical protein